MILPLDVSFPLCILFRWSFCRLVRVWIRWKVPWISCQVSRKFSLIEREREVKCLAGVFQNNNANKKNKKNSVKIRKINNFIQNIQLLTLHWEGK